MRIVFVVERPTQFEAPFYRYAAGRPEASLEVLFTRPEPAREVFDPELGRAVDWGFDLLAGYEWASAPPRGTARWLGRQIARRRPDLVIVNGYTRRDYQAAAIAARLRGVPAALRTDTVLWPDREAPKRSRRLLYRGPLSALFRLFFTTGTLGRRFLAGCGIPPERIALLPYAVDVEHFRRASALSAEERERLRADLGVPARARVVLSLAKFSGREAPWDLLRAFCGLPEEDLWLVLAGDGPERGALVDFSARSGSGRVVLPGYVPYPRLPALYGAADLFVHPAAEERWGVSVAEAMAAGLPVVASTRVGAACDLVRPGENGRLYQVGDAADLRRALEAALALESAAVADVDLQVLASQDYGAVWKNLVEGAGRVARPRPGRPGDSRSPVPGRPLEATAELRGEVRARERWIPRILRALPRWLHRHKVIALLARLMPWARVASFSFNGGARTIADLSDPAPRQVLITGVFEPEFFDIARCFVAPSTAVLDVGANHGFCTMGLVATTQPSAGVSFHMFEANPVLCRSLRDAARLYPRHDIRVEEGCVTDRPGESRLYVVPGHSGASHVVDDASGRPIGNIVLDEYLDEAGIDQVSLVKMDVEGSEPRAVRGLARALNEGRVSALYLEVSGANLARYGTSPAELIALLRKVGCDVFWCKAGDFASSLAPPPQRVLVREDTSLSLARVGEFPRAHQTDLLAVPRSGRYRELLQRVR